MSGFSSKNVQELGSQVPDFLHVWTCVRLCWEYIWILHWKVEFKGIMQPVLFMIFFLDFVTPHDSAIFRAHGFNFQVIFMNFFLDFVTPLKMSEGCLWTKPKCHSKTDFNQYLGQYWFILPTVFCVCAMKATFWATFHLKSGLKKAILRKI